MTFANPARANGEEILKELEREVIVQRLKDGAEMVVTVRLSQDLLARKPAEFVLLEKEAPVVVPSESIPVEPVKYNIGTASSPSVTPEQTITKEEEEEEEEDEKA